MILSLFLGNPQVDGRPGRAPRRGGARGPSVRTASPSAVTATAAASQNGADAATHPSRTLPAKWLTIRANVCAEAETPKTAPCSEGGVDFDSRPISEGLDRP